MKYSKNDWVAWRQGQSTFQCQVVGTYPENNPPALRIVKHSDNEWIVRESEVEPWQDYMERQNQKKIDAARENCTDIIRAWEAGHRDSKSIAEFLGVKPQNVSSTLRQAVRYGFVKTETEAA